MKVSKKHPPTPRRLPTSEKPEPHQKRKPGNSCKGKGGCKTSDAGCKGKNSCKGKGGCATDGSHKAEDHK